VANGPASVVRTPLAQPRVILVEGREDLRFYASACRAANVLNRVELRPVEGWSNFARHVRTLLSVGTALRAIAIIRDAESNGQGAFRSACSAFSQAGLPQPTQPGQLSIPDAQGRYTAVLVVPPGRKGSIETMCLESLNGQVPLNCAQDFVACLDGYDPPPASRTQAQQDKRTIGAMMIAGASSPRPLRIGARLGEAAEQGYWDWTHPAFQPVMAFVDMVANIP
jgi:hypothetical protein